MKIHKLHSKLETLLVALLQGSESYLMNGDKIEIQNFIYHKEYFLALQSFCYGFLEDGKNLSNSQIELIDELMRLMGIDQEEDDDFWLWEMFQQVLNNRIV